MREHPLIVLKSACLILALVIVVQLFGLFQKPNPLLGIENSSLLKPAAAPAAKEAPPAAAGKKTDAEAAKKAAPPAPDPRQQTIEKSGIFGDAPKKGRPARPSLLGLAGDRAILKLPDGKVELVAEGAELSGVKVLRIATNRVLVEFRGKKLELTIFSGLGSDSLSEKSSGKEKEIKESKREKE